MDVFAPRDWLPGERPILPGSPSSPTHTAARRAAYASVGALVSLTGGLGNALVTVNLSYLQGALGAYSAELQWLPAAYAMGMVSMNLLIVKFRQQYGLRVFTELALGTYACITFAHLFVHGLGAAIAVRVAHGVAGAGMTVLGLYYILQAFPAQHRLKGLVVGIGLPQLAMPLARLFSSRLLEYGEWRGLYLFELGLALSALGCVLVLKLPSGDRLRVFERRDFLTFGLFAPGVALLCAVLGLGRTVWWFEAPWLGYCLAGAIVLVGASLALEQERSAPLLNTRWLGSARIARLALSVLLIRIVLAEATGSVGFLQSLGLNNDQMQMLWMVVVAGAAGGLATSALTLTPPRLTSSLMIALVLIATGAFMDAFATNLTRPANMYVSQFLLAFGGTFFLGPTFVAGFGAVIAAPQNLVSFSVMFTITQNLGGLAGAALVGTVQVLREKYHSSQLVEHLSLLDPQVAARVQAGGAAFGSVLGDPASRNAQGIAALGAAATREANILAYNDVFLAIGILALLILAWMVANQVRDSLRAAAVPQANAQAGAGQASIAGSGGL